MQVMLGPELFRSGIDVAAFSIGGVDMANRDRELSEVLEQIASGAHRGTGSLIADYSWPIEGHRPRSLKATLAP